MTTTVAPTLLTVGPTAQVAIDELAISELFNAQLYFQDPDVAQTARGHTTDHQVGSGPRAFLVNFNTKPTDARLFVTVTIEASGPEPLVGLNLQMTYQQLMNAVRRHYTPEDVYIGPDSLQFSIAKLQPNAAVPTV